MSVTVSLSVAELISRADGHVPRERVMFIVGATLAQIGRLQKFFRAAHADSPEEARAIKSALDKIRLPIHYQYARRGTPMQKLGTLSVSVTGLMASLASLLTSWQEPQLLLVDKNPNQGTQETDEGWLLLK